MKTIKKKQTPSLKLFTMMMVVSFILLCSLSIAEDEAITNKPTAVHKLVIHFSKFTLERHQLYSHLLLQIVSTKAIVKFKVVPKENLPYISKFKHKFDSAINDYRKILFLTDNNHRKYLNKDILDEATQLPINEKIALINKYVNLKPRRYDIQEDGTDYWNNPVMTEINGGDCEDLAILKYTYLAALNIPTDRLIILISEVGRRYDNEVHASLLVLPENNQNPPLLLDNGTISEEVVSFYKVNIVGIEAINKDTVIPLEGYRLNYNLVTGSKN